MDQPIISNQPTFTQESVVIPEPVKKPFPKRLLILLLFLLVAGLSFFAYKYWQLKQQVVQTQPPSLVAVSPSSDPTAAWENYSNSRYGYSVKYPNSWYLYEPKNSSSTVGFWIEKSEGEASGVWIFIQENPQKLSVKNWWQENVANQSPTNEYSNTNIKTLSVDGAEGLLVQSGLGWSSRPFTSIYVAKGDKIFHFNTNFIDSDEKYHYFDQILSTFKFTESNQNSADWKTFTFPLMSVKLPLDWVTTPTKNPLQFLNYVPDEKSGRSFDPALDKGKLKFEIYENDSTGSLEDYVAQQKASVIDIRGEDVVWQEGQAIINGQKAIKVTSVNLGFSNDSYYVKHPSADKIYTLAFGLDFNNYQGLITQILDNFTFN